MRILRERGREKRDKRDKRERKEGKERREREEREKRERRELWVALGVRVPGISKLQKLHFQLEKLF